MKKAKKVDYEEAFHKLEKIIKIELAALEDDLWVLQDLKLMKRKLGQWEESRAYHRTLAKVLMTMRKLEGREKDVEDEDE